VKQKIRRSIAIGAMIVVLPGWQTAGAQVGAAEAEPDDGGIHTHTHIPLIVDADMTWETLLEAALAVNPMRFELAAGAEMADAWSQQGGNLLAGAPAVTFSGLSDDAFDNRGQSEVEAGIEVPLWRIGQKDAAQGVAASASAESQAAVARMRLELAGMLRSSLWDIAAAGQALDQAEAALALTTELTVVVATRVERGDLPRADLLLARAAEYERGVQRVESEAMLLDAERSFRSLTGLDSRPENFMEARIARDDFDAGHPALALAMRDLERAEAELDYADKSRRGSPTLTIGPRHQRDPLTDYYNDSLTIAVRMPVGGRNHGLVERAAVSRQVAEARSRLAALERRLDLNLHEAEHELFVIEESLELVGPQTELAEQRLGLSRTAFAQGEIDLQELLRVQDAAITARGAYARLNIERQRAIAALNQALGELP
jgi:outer membrane protein TolC